jgi:hypothetical protein
MIQKSGVGGVVSEETENSNSPAMPKPPDTRLANGIVAFNLNG